MLGVGLGSIVMDVYLTGLLTGLALIVAIGAQNAFVLRQGIRREHVGAVIAICAVADVVLMSLGTLGIGTIVERAPWLLTALRWGGAAYLVWFAIGSFRCALSPRTMAEADGTAAGGSLRRVVGTALALTFLNPHVYLDTVVMLGSVANQQGEQRWIFTMGAWSGSFVWFTALGLGARALARPLNRPATWRAVDLGVGVVMLVIAATLILTG